MATTLTFRPRVWPTLYLLQVGDSRAYQLLDEARAPKRVTRTVAQELVDT